MRNINFEGQTEVYGGIEDKIKKRKRIRYENLVHQRKSWVKGKRKERDSHPFKATSF